MTNPNALQWFKRRRGGAAYNPLTDPAFLGLWVAADATDNGTTLTVPNRKSGGTALTSTGVGRPTIAATAINNGPGILVTGATSSLGGALAGATGKTSMTVLVAAALSVNAACLWQFGTGNKSWFCFNTLGRGFQVYKQTGTGTMTNGGVNKGLVYPRVVTSRFDDSLAFDIVSTRQQGLVGPATPAGTDAAGPLAAGTFWLGTNNTTSSVSTGHMYGAMAFSRYLSDSECAIAESYVNNLMGQSFRREIMWEGDSIVAGAELNGALWRRRLEENYQAAALADGRYWYNACGWGASSNPTFTNDHTPSGGGQTVATMRTFWNANGLGTNYQPDVLWITVGTNNIALGQSNATLSTNYLAALVDARARLPNARIVVEQLFPRNDGFAAQVLDWNANYHGQLIIDANALGLNVVGKSTWTDYGTSIGGYTYLDGVHIAAANTNGIGDAAWAALKTFVGVS